MPPFTQGRRTSAWCSSVRARATSTSTKQQRLPRVCRIMSDAWASSLTPMRSCWNTPSPAAISTRSEEHTSELQSLMRISYAVFCLKKKIKQLQLYINDILHIYLYFKQLQYT